MVSHHAVGDDLDAAEGSQFEEESGESFLPTSSRELSPTTRETQWSRRTGPQTP